MAKVGRPSSYTIEKAAILCRRLTEGESLFSICKDDAMPSLDTVYQWLMKHKEFAESYARARENQADTLADEINYIADNEPDPDRARVRIDARKWTASKLKPKKYGNVIDITTNGKDLPKPIFMGNANITLPATNNTIIGQQVSEGEIVKDS